MANIRKFDSLTALGKWEKLRRKPNLSDEFLHQIRRNIAEMEHRKPTPRKVQEQKPLEMHWKKPKADPFYKKMIDAPRSVASKAVSFIGRMFRGPRKVGA